MRLDILSVHLVMGADRKHDYDDILTFHGENYSVIFRIV